METEFDRYRAGKEKYGGRIDAQSTWFGWILIAVLTAFVGISWWFAWGGYSQLRQRIVSHEEPEMVMGSTGTGTDQDSIRPGLLLTERKPTELAVVFFDVGQGDAIFIRTPMKENILIDAGEGTNPDFKFARQVDAANRLILPFFKRNKIDHLDYFITTHPHSDHIGGAYDIVKNMSIDKVWIAGMEHPTRSKKDFLTAIKNKKAQTSIQLERPSKKGGTLKEGQSIEIKGSTKGWLLRTNPYAKNVNRSSLVTLFYYGKTGFLFTGDTEKPGEYELIQEWGKQLDVEVLKVGHHGSHTSSIKPFVKTVDPKYSVIMVGHYNTFGHPTDEVLSRLKRVGSKIYRTDRDGTVFMFSDGKSIRTITQPAVSAVND